ncbi:MAG TPA: hypothetical protein VGK73_30390 [Polyangiaceae bacterium]
MKASLYAAVFVLSACNGASDDRLVLAAHQGTRAVTDPGDSHEAICLTQRANKPQGNGSEVWVRGFDGEGAADAASVAADRAGNAYATRADGGTLKFSSTGELVWSKPYGSLVSIAANDDVIVAGSFTGSIEIEGVTLAATGGKDVYVVTLDSAGVPKQRSVLGGAGDEELAGVAVLQTGGVVVSVAGLGTTLLDSTGASVWTRELSGVVAVDPSDNVLVTGGFSGTQDFGGGPLVSAGGRDVFVVKLGADGRHLFSARFGDTGSSQEGQAIASDFLGNILVSGVFDGSIDFGTGALSPAKCPADVWCARSGFVAKFGPDGSALWGTARGPLRALTGIASNSAGEVVISGATPGGVPSYRIPLIAVLDAEGEELWEKSEWPASGVGSGRRVAVDPCGDLLWALSVRPSLDTSERAYLAKLSP